MKVRPIYNLEFPSWCNELNIFGYRFSRTDDYQERFLSLQHLDSSIYEFAEEPNTGTHSVTAFVDLPESEEEAVLNWSGSNKTALLDVLFLLTMFTRRDVFAGKPQNDRGIRRSRDVIIADPRVYEWGGVLRCSIPYKKMPIDPDPFGYDIGFEEGLNQINELIRSNEWQSEYKGGYFLILARMAFRRQPLESSYVQCWTVWEHLFAILNSHWLSDKQIHSTGSIEKVSFLLTKYALTTEINVPSRKRIEALAEIRNRLVHFGRFPERGSVHDDAILFIRLTEFIIAKILGLSPSNVFNTVEKLETFLGKVERKASEMADEEFHTAVERAIKQYEVANSHAANRTRSMIYEHGEVQALSRLMLTADLQQGFKVLRDSGKLDKTFESVVVRFQHLFSPEVVEGAQWRLKHPNDLFQHGKTS